MLVTVYNIKSTRKSIFNSFYDLYAYFGSNLPMFFCLNNLGEGSNMIQELSNDIISNNLPAEYLVCVDSNTNISEICQKFNYICTQLIEINIDLATYNNTHQIVLYESDGQISYKLVKL